jgi:hypothetical protein
MHVLIPFASVLSDTATQILRDLPLPHLTGLLARLTSVHRDEADEYVLSPPHERALAAAWGWQGAEGCLPFAAQLAKVDGIETADLAWGLLTPAHWHVGRDHITLLDPAGLNLDDTTSRALFDAVRGLFESEGFAMSYGAPTRWYAAHESFAELPCASIDRVIGRNVDVWLPTQPQARLIRRLQNEVQMLLYPHALTEAREAQGLLPVNSFWLSGCGRAQPANPVAVQVHNHLRAPALAGDWAAWAQAWRTLDAGPLADLLDRSADHTEVRLTLCGERHSERLDNPPRSLWQRLSRRWKAPQPAHLLETL